MAYNPSLYDPYRAQQFQPAQFQPAQPMFQQVVQPVNGLIKVDGIEGAQMFQLPPNSVSPPLFVAEENAFFVKTTDGGGAASLKKYTFQEEPIASSTNPEFVTREYFDNKINEMMEAINGQHAVPGQTTSAGQFVAQPSQQAQVAGAVEHLVQPDVPV